jgi:hypothetical protein
VEPGQRYGEAYFYRTKFWSTLFKSAPEE